MNAFSESLKRMENEDKELYNYTLKYFVQHSYQGKEYEDLRALFETDEWLHARFEGVENNRYTYAGYIEDLMIAWRNVAHPEALAQIEAGKEPVALADCVRYVLIRTSINSLAGNYVPELVARAVETGLWKPVRALALARNVPDVEQRAKLFNLLLDTGMLDEKQFVETAEEALKAALDISKGGRAKALAALAPYLEGKLLARALKVISAFNDAQHRAEALTVLASQLEGELLELALDAALAIDKEGGRVEVLTALASQLEGNEQQTVLKHALKSTLDIDNESDQVEALKILAPCLEGKLLQRALEAVLVMEDWNSANALITLASQLKGKLLQKALETTIATEDEWLRGDALAYFKDERSRAKALAALIPQLKGDARQIALNYALKSALAIDNECGQAEALATLSPQLEGKLLARALEFVLAIEDESELAAEALAALIPQLEGELLERALGAVLANEDEYYLV